MPDTIEASLYMSQIVDGFGALSAIVACEEPSDNIGVAFNALQLPAKKRRVSQNLLPAGVERRSPGHAIIMRAAKRMKVLTNKVVTDRQSLQARGEAWNVEHGLRVGDRVLLDSTDNEDDKRQGVHPRQWTYSGLMKIGWREVGSRGSQGQSGPVGLNETHRQLDACVSLARAAELSSALELGAWLDHLPAGGTLHIERHFDATPLRLSFGALQGRLQENSSYLIPDNNRPGMLKKVSWDEFHQVYPSVAPNSGILEVMAQSLSVHTTTELNGITVKQSRQCLIAPSILQRANASVTFSAVDKSVP